MSPADAALMANYLEIRGIIARPIREPRVLGSQAIFEASGILIRPKDLPLARRLIERITSRRARRQRPAEFPWDSFSIIGLHVLLITSGAGGGIGALIGGSTDWEQVCIGVGGGFGFIIGLSLMIWLYRVRKRADAGIPVAKATVGEIG
jgi:hypothetical protein